VKLQSLKDKNSQPPQHTVYVINLRQRAKSNITAVFIHTYLRSMRSFSQLPMKVPNWHDWTWSCSVSKNLSLNWNVAGNCCSNCQVQSMNCVNTGDTSLESPATWPHRSLNLWPNASHSFSIRAYRTNNYIFFHFNYDLSPVSLVQCNLTSNGIEG